MMTSRPYARQFRKAMLSRELGLLRPLATNLDPTCLLGGLYTTPEAEYGFRNVNRSGESQAIPPYSLSYSRTALHGHALAAGDEEGILTIVDTRRSLREQMHAATPQEAPMARFRAHDNAIFDLIWLKDDKQVATSAGDGSVRVFDIEGTYRRALLRGTTKSVKCVRALPGCDDVLFTASRDGNVRAFDLRCPAICDVSQYPEAFHSPVFTIEQPHSRRPPARKRRRVEADPLGSVTTLAFRPGTTSELFTAGAVDGSVKLWDIRSTGSIQGNAKATCVASVTPCMQRPGAPRTYGIASMAVHEAGHRLLISSTDSRIYVYDTADVNLGYTKCLAGHTQTGFYIRAKFSPCGRYVLSGSADTKGYIWDTQRPVRHGVVDPLFELEGHRGGEAAAVDWCKTDPFEVATCGDDSTVKVWRVDALRRPAAMRECDSMGCNTSSSTGSQLNGARIARSSEDRICKTRKMSSMSMVGNSGRRLRDADIRQFFGKSTLEVPKAEHVH